MEYHLERALKLNTEPKYKSLYPWAIVEERDKGEPQDLIPWQWALNFLATKCLLQDSVDATLGIRLHPDDSPPTIKQQQVIRINLQADGGGNSLLRTRYSMFGTSREIEDIWLLVYQGPDEDTAESCQAWGCASYTAEIDFRTSRNDDTLGFHLFVKPSTFARFASMILAGTFNSINFRVGRVSGFYSDWSPGISTNNIKVLTADKQTQSIADAGEVNPPRLKEVEEFGIYFNRTIELGADRPAETLPPPERREAAPQSRVSAPDPEQKKLLKSLRSAAWYAVALLSVLAFKALSH